MQRGIGSFFDGIFMMDFEGFGDSKIVGCSDCIVILVTKALKELHINNSKDFTKSCHFSDNSRVHQ